MSKATVKVVVFHCWIAPDLTQSRGFVPLPPTWLFLLASAVSLLQRLACEQSAVGEALTSHLCYTHHVTAQQQTRVKLNRVFFPR